MRAWLPWWVAALAAAVALSAASANAEPRALTLGTGSSLVVRTYRDGVGARWAQDHVIEATEVTGQASWDDAAPDALTVSVTVQAASLRVDPPELRARFGLKEPMSDKNRASVEKALKGKETLDVRRYPTISFRSTSSKRDASGTLQLRGEFKLHGRSHAVTVPVTVSPQPDGSVIGEGTFRIKTSDYGIRPYSAFLGALKVKDEVDLVIKLVGVPE